MTSIGAVMPTYGQAEFIIAALDSIAPQVDELVVLLDGNGDDTLRALLDWDAPARCALRIIQREENRGTAAAINSAVEFLSPGHDWWTWVSSDNIYHPTWRDMMLDAAGDDVGALYSGFTYRRGQSKAYHYTVHSPSRLVSQEACYYGPSFLIRPSVWQEHRGRISHDYDNWTRVEEACWDADLRIRGVPNALCEYNAHDKRVTVTRRHEYDAPHWQAEAKERRRIL